MPGKWLVKTEPTAYSFARLAKDGRTRWDGVTNPLALKYLRSIRRGDPVLVYHTGNGRAVVGLARAASDPYPEPKAKDPRLVVIDLEPDRPLARAVPLDEIKKNPKFRSFELLRISRLSIMPVPDALWDELMRMAR